MHSINRDASKLIRTDHHQSESESTQCVTIGFLQAIGKKANVQNSEFRLQTIAKHCRDALNAVSYPFM